MRFSKLTSVKAPERGTPESAGIDFFIPDYAFDELFFELLPGNRVNLPSGIKMDVPDGYALVAFNKSGVSLKKGLTVGASVVDSDYQGEIHLSLVNTSNHPVTLYPGEKIVQFLLIPINFVELEEVELGKLFDSITVRGEGRFGSTNK